MFRETLGNHGLPASGGGLGQRVRLLRLPEAEIDEGWLHRDSSDHPARTVPRLAIKAASCADSVRQVAHDFKLKELSRCIAVVYFR